jgi:AraC family transcriptional regulator
VKMISSSIESILEGSINIVAHVHAKKPRVFIYPHSTQAQWYLLMPEEGSFQYKVMDDQGTAAFGDLVLCPPGETIHRHALAPLSFHTFVFEWVSADSHFLQKEDIPFYGKIGFRNQMQLISILEGLERLDDPLLQEQPYWKQKLLYTLLLFIFMDRLSLGATSPIDQPGLFLSDAKRLLLEKAYGDASVQQIAAKKGLTKEHFCTKFKKEAGLSPTEYVTHIRMNKARSLLLETAYTLEEIAQHCGYQSGFYLSRMFTNHYKMSPSQYRKKHRV